MTGGMSSRTCYTRLNFDFPYVRSLSLRRDTFILFCIRACITRHVRVYRQTPPRTVIHGNDYKTNDTYQWKYALIFVLDIYVYQLSFFAVQFIRGRDNNKASFIPFRKQIRFPKLH